MTGKKKDINDLYDLLLEQLRDLYDGELQQINFFKKAEDLTSSIDLQDMIDMHSNETRMQIVRLEKVFKMLGEKPTGEKCDGIKGIITEALKLTNRCNNPEVSDAALITAIQHINHYEIAGYGTAASYAKILGNHVVAEQLIHTLREEKDADLGLSDLAEGEINIDAALHTLLQKSEGASANINP